MESENPGMEVQVGSFGLQGDLFLPDPETKEIILFAHGSGSSRHSLRNRYVARLLNEAGYGTLLIDLLTPEEEQEETFTDYWRSNIDLLANRLVDTTDWLQQYFAATHADPSLKMGFFGANTGAAAALAASAKRPDLVLAVVSRGGRPDLAGDVLRDVKAATLLVVGGEDAAVIGLNEEAFHKIGGEEKQLIIVPGASHLFVEPGTLAEVGNLAKEWFDIYLKETELRDFEAA
jgi:putative phosphoribosyl transferase